MSSNRSIAVTTGVMFIIATLGSLASTALTASILGAPDYLARIWANEGQFLLGAVFQLIGAVACPGIALAMYPVLKNHGVGFALASVGFRLIEGTLYVLIVVCLLLLVTVSHEAATAAAPAASAYSVTAVMLLAARDWLGPVGAVLTFGLGAFMYYWVMYRSRLVPRWLSGWGLAGVTLLMVSGLLVMFRLAVPLGTAQAILAIPIAVQEMVLAVWLIAKGFNPSVVTAETSGGTTRAAALSTASAT